MAFSFIEGGEKQNEIDNLLKLWYFLLLK